MNLMAQKERGPFRIGLYGEMNRAMELTATCKGIQLSKMDLHYWQFETSTDWHEKLTSNRFLVEATEKLVNAATLMLFSLAEEAKTLDNC